MSSLMITFLTRYYGEAVPIYSIRGINPLINSFAPALLAPLFAHFEPFAAMCAAAAAAPTAAAAATRAPPSAPEFPYCRCRHQSLCRRHRRRRQGL